MDITNSLIVCDIKRTYERKFTAEEIQLKLEMIQKDVWSAEWANIGPVVEYEKHSDWIAYL